ncbi:TetR/AcrR family transcriptional regulator [Enterococcus sp. 669A]|uniref:TetR/AcrR family transcriptional regulator n=1 Tax=Candidatus Enterococcus moelleringii TaxID=2815325 RepID=A0ABS3L5T8_9ENTE|nr:TetR/AcrR family transcriptional regulator [Enterococcus sp. 669A]MBO1304973.1 TetR/AcrR family transcriptional regulator [Enterococcus sp. 669A]
MKHNSNEERKRQKREAILKSARKVFAKKGLIDVTMKDIIDACGISRGGIYLYFDSVDEIFIETVKQRNSRKFDSIRSAIKENQPFDELLDSYFNSHKKRLLDTINDSMLRAMYEYYFTHKSDADREFQQAQMGATKQTISEILELGIQQGVLESKPLDLLAENFMFVIEGLSVLALIGDISEAQIDRQFSLMKSLLPRV